MGLFSAWRHHLENEANRRIIAELPSRKQRNQGKRAAAAAPAEKSTPRLSPELERRQSIIMWQTKLAEAERASNDEIAATYRLLIQRLEADSPEVRQAATVEQWRATAGRMTNPKAAAKMRAMADRVEAMNTEQWLAHEAKVAR